MENWLYDWTTVKKLTSHYKTGDSLPPGIFQQILKGKSLKLNSFSSEYIVLLVRLNQPNLKRRT